MRSAVITVGTELLRGGGVDSNTALVGSRLLDLGIETVVSVSVADSVDDIAGAVKQLESSHDILAVIGGLGPTFDDVTREGVSKAFRLALVRDEALERELRRRYGEMGLEPTQEALRQADVLEAADVLAPSEGTAPGQVLRHHSTVLVLMPGVQTELVAMMEDSLIPWLKEHLSLVDRTRSRRLRLAGMLEVEVQRLVDPVMERHPEALWSILAYPEETHVVIYEARGERGATVDRVAAEVEEVLGEAVFGRDDQTLEATVVGLLAAGELTVATAESCTGGLIAKRITDVPGASTVFGGGVVAYSDEAKLDWLSVPRELLHEYGQVSSPVVSAMAENIRLARRATFGLAVSGIAGPSGGGGEKPTGLVYVALADESGSRATRHVLPGGRGSVRWRASQVALDQLRRSVSARILKDAGGRASE